MNLGCQFLINVLLLSSGFFFSNPIIGQEREPFQVHFQKVLPVEGSPVRLSSPEALSVDSKGNLYVLDTGNSRIVKFDSTGKAIDFVGGFGWEREQFDRPLDITVKSLLDVFVADFNNERIERYDRDLNFISSYLSDVSTAPDLQFTFPSGVDFSRHGELFISDNENDRVLKLNSFGKPVLSFGDFNSGEGQLEDAGKLEIGGNDAVYVADIGRGDIVVFDYYGNYLSRFGGERLKAPRGLFWTESFLYVADSGSNSVTMFNQTHHFVFAWGSRGRKIGAFDRPVDISLFKNRIYVLDSNNSRIQVFALQAVASD